MKNLDKVANGIAFDTETHKFQPGLDIPPLVCMSLSDSDSDELLLKSEAVVKFKELLYSDRVIILANAPFDITVTLQERSYLSLVKKVFELYRNDMFYDILLAERLHDLAEGMLNMRGRAFDLDQVTYRVLDREGAKFNDTFRTSYALLENTPIDQWPEEAQRYPIDDSRNTYDVAVAQIQRNRNLHDLGNQMRADFAMRLGACHGFLVDPVRLAKVKQETIESREAEQERFLKIGFLKNEDKKIKVNKSRIKKTICEMYGVRDACPVCDGSGKVPGTTRCPKTKCKGDDCEKCMGFRYKPKNCKDCDSTGYDLDSIPISRTDKGAVSTDRDSLHESGDDDLIDFAVYSEDEKILTTYVPWLEKGIDENGNQIPLTLKPRVLKATGRTGYGDVVHQLPRKSGIRECLVTRKGEVLISVDYEGAELVTHAQNLLNIVGKNGLATALNSGIKVHDKLGASLANVSYDSMIANRKTDKKLGNARQAAKPQNFGYPGRMGVATLVKAQRKNGPDTTSKTGKVYKGLRFCILMNDAKVCGVVKVQEWEGRPISPTCLECLKAAAKGKKAWFKEWDGHKEYFEEVQKADERGYMIQHWSKRVRGGASIPAIANGYFQGMAGDAIKIAMFDMSEKMYSDPDSVLFGSRLILNVHDEIVATAREEVASDVAKEIARIMEEALLEVCPDMGPAIYAEPALMRRLSKNAEPVWDEEGNLKVWEE